MSATATNAGPTGIVDLYAFAVQHPTSTTISRATWYVYSDDTAQIRGGFNFYGLYPVNLHLN